MISLAKLQRRIDAGDLSADAAIAQSMEATGVSAPFGMGEIPFGLAAGALLGTTAKLRGSWV